MRVALALLTLACTTVARAEGVAIVRSAEPIVHNCGTCMAGVAGIKFGMSAGEVRMRIASDYKGQAPRSESQSLSLHQGGKVIEAQLYPKVFDVSDSDHSSRLRVHFGTPSTGDRVVAIDHSVFYDQTKPAYAVADLFARLNALYGRESGPVRLVRNRFIHASWLFDANGPVPCLSYGCTTAGVALDLDSMASLAEQLSLDHHVVISVIVRTADDDLARVESFEIMAEDIANEYLSLAKARRQLETAAARMPGSKP